MMQQSHIGSIMAVQQLQSQWVLESKMESKSTQGSKGGSASVNALFPQPLPQQHAMDDRDVLRNNSNLSSSTTLLSGSCFSASADADVYVDADADADCDDRIGTDAIAHTSLSPSPCTSTSTSSNQSDIINRTGKICTAKFAKSALPTYEVPSSSMLFGSAYKKRPTPICTGGSGNSNNAFGFAITPCTFTCAPGTAMSTTSTTRGSLASFSFKSKDSSLDLLDRFPELREQDDDIDVNHDDFSLASLKDFFLADPKDVFAKLSKNKGNDKCSFDQDDDPMEEEDELIDHHYYDNEKDMECGPENFEHTNKNYDHCDHCQDSTFTFSPSEAMQTRASHIPHDLNVVPSFASLQHNDGSRSFYSSSSSPGSTCAIYGVSGGGRSSSLLPFRPSKFIDVFHDKDQYKKYYCGDHHEKYDLNQDYVNVETAQQHDYEDPDEQEELEIAEKKDRDDDDGPVLFIDSIPPNTIIGSTETPHTYLPVMKRRRVSLDMDEGSYNIHEPKSCITNTMMMEDLVTTPKTTKKALMMNASTHASVSDNKSKKRNIDCQYDHQENDHTSPDDQIFYAPTPIYANKSIEGTKLYANTIRRAFDSWNNVNDSSSIITSHDQRDNKVVTTSMTNILAPSTAKLAPRKYYSPFQSYRDCNNSKNHDHVQNQNEEHNVVTNEEKDHEQYEYHSPEITNIIKNRSINDIQLKGPPLLRRRHKADVDFMF